MFESAWTRRGDAPAESGALRNATLAPEAMILDGVVLEPTTGAVRWDPAPSAAVGISGGAVIVVRREGDRWTTIERRDPATGTVLGEAPVRGPDGAPLPLRAFNARLDLAGDRVVYAYLGRVAAFAVADGAQAWSQNVSGDAGLVISGNLVGLIGERELIVCDAATGAERWRAPFDAIDAVASPRGGFFVSRDQKVVELDASGREVRTASGRFSAAAGDLLAVATGKDLAVIDGAGDEVDRVMPRDGNDYVGAGGMCAGALVYFRKADATVWWRPLRGKEIPVVKVAGKVGATDRGPAVAGATLTEPPRCTGGVVLVQDWFISAYRIPG